MMKRITLSLLLLLSVHHARSIQVPTPPPTGIYQPMVHKRQSDATGEVFKALRYAQSNFKHLPATDQVLNRNYELITVKKEYGYPALVKATRNALSNQGLVALHRWIVTDHGPIGITELHHTPSGQFITSEMPLSHFARGHVYAQHTPINNPSVCTWIKLFTYAAILGLECPLEGENRTTMDEKTEPIDNQER